MCTPRTLKSYVHAATVLIPVVIDTLNTPYPLWQPSSNTQQTDWPTTAAACNKHGKKGRRNPVCHVQ